MVLFFLNSPAQLLHRVLPLIKENNYKNLTIVAPPELRPFLLKATKAKIITPKVHQNLIDGKTKRKIISNAIRAKLEYRKHFKHIKGEEIHLFFNAWAITYLSFVKKLSKHNRVFFYPEADACMIQEEEHGIRAFFMKLVAKYLLGVNVVIMNKADLPIWEVPEGEIPWEVVHYDKFDGSLPPELMTDPKLLEGMEVLFLGHDITSEGADEEEIIKITDVVMDIFEENYPISYVIKQHPRERTLYGKMNTPKRLLPPEMLAESLYNHDWKFIISYYSEAGITAKKQTNATVISLLNFWHFEKPSLKDYWVKRFEDEGILLPKTIKELNSIMKCGDD